MTTLKILIADDSEIIRKALINMLSSEGSAWAVCGEAADSDEALSKVDELLPDILLLDISLPTLNGVKIAEKLKQTHPNLAIVLISEQDPAMMKLLAARLGVYGIPKSRLHEELLPMLKSIQQTLPATRRF